MLLLLLLLLLLPAAAQPPIVTRDQWGSKPQPLADELRQTPRRLVIHHAGVVWKRGDDPRKKIVALQVWGQREKSWPDLPYHYLLAPSGEIFEGRDWHYRPESNTRYELDGVINVQLWGDFEQQKVTPAQLQSLVDLLVWLCRQHGFGVDVLTSHRDQAPGQTTCPGRDLAWYMDRGWLRQWVAKGLAGGSPVVFRSWL